MSENLIHILGGLLNEISFRASKSSGPGGQHVNKANTKVELCFDVGASLVLSPDEKQRVLTKLASKVNANGVLQLSCQVHRSQFKNKQECIDKFMLLLAGALKVGKKRKKTGATLASKLKRLDAKRHRSERKRQRQKPGLL